MGELVRRRETPLDRFYAAFPEYSEKNIVPVDFTLDEMKQELARTVINATDQRVIMGHLRYIAVNSNMEVNADGLADYIRDHVLFEVTSVERWAILEPILARIEYLFNSKWPMPGMGCRHALCLDLGRRRAVQALVLMYMEIEPQENRWVFLAKEAPKGVVYDLPRGMWPLLDATDSVNGSFCWLRCTRRVIETQLGMTISIKTLDTISLRNHIRMTLDDHGKPTLFFRIDNKADRPGTARGRKQTNLAYFWLDTLQQAYPSVEDKRVDLAKDEIEYLQHHEGRAKFLDEFHRVPVVIKKEPAPMSVVDEQEPVQAAKYTREDFTRKFEYTGHGPTASPNLAQVRVDVERQLVGPPPVVKGAMIEFDTVGKTLTRPIEEKDVREASWTELYSELRAFLQTGKDLAVKKSTFQDFLGNVMFEIERQQASYAKQPVADPDLVPAVPVPITLDTPGMLLSPIQLFVQVLEDTAPAFRITARTLEARRQLTLGERARNVGFTGADLLLVISGDATRRPVPFDVPRIRATFPRVIDALLGPLARQNRLFRAFASNPGDRQLRASIQPAIQLVIDQVAPAQSMIPIPREPRPRRTTPPTLPKPSVAPVPVQPVIPTSPSKLPVPPQPVIPTSPSILPVPTPAMTLTDELVEFDAIVTRTYVWNLEQGIRELRQLKENVSNTIAAIPGNRLTAHGAALVVVLHAVGAALDALRDALLMREKRLTFHTVAYHKAETDVFATEYHHPTMVSTMKQIQALLITASGHPTPLPTSVLPPTSIPPLAPVPVQPIIVPAPTQPATSPGSPRTSLVNAVVIAMGNDLRQLAKTIEHTAIAGLRLSFHEPVPSDSIVWSHDTVTEAVETGKQQYKDTILAYLLTRASNPEARLEDLKAPLSPAAMAVFDRSASYHELQGQQAWLDRLVEQGITTVHSPDVARRLVPLVHWLRRAVVEALVTYWSHGITRVVMGKHAIRLNVVNHDVFTFGEDALHMMPLPMFKPMLVDLSPGTFEPVALGDGPVLIKILSPMTPDATDVTKEGLDLTLRDMARGEWSPVAKDEPVSLTLRYEDTGHMDRRFFLRSLSDGYTALLAQLVAPAHRIMAHVSDLGTSSRATFLWMWLAGLDVPDEWHALDTDDVLAIMALACGTSITLDEQVARRVEQGVYNVLLPTAEQEAYRHG